MLGSILFDSFIEDSLLQAFDLSAPNAQAVYRLGYEAMTAIRLPIRPQMGAGAYRLDEASHKVKPSGVDAPSAPDAQDMDYRQDGSFFAVLAIQSESAITHKGFQACK